MEQGKKAKGEKESSHLAKRVVPMSDANSVRSSVVYGADAIERIADKLSFPIGRDEVIRLVGDRFVDWTKGHSVGLRGIIEKCPQDTFTDAAMLISAISEVMDSRER